MSPSSKLGLLLRGWATCLLLAGLAGAPGCTTHQILPSDFARNGVAWSGPPVPIRVGVAAVQIVDEDLPPFMADVARQSLVNVLAKSGVVLAARDLVLEGATPTADTRSTLATPRELDFVLLARLEHFDLYTSYEWCAIYAACFGLPIPGSGIAGAILALSGGPLVIDRGQQWLTVDMFDTRSRRIVATYHSRFEGEQIHTLYESVRVDESYVAHPELLFAAACGDVAHQLGRDRFWLRRFVR